MRIADFGHSTAPSATSALERPSLTRRDALLRWASVDSRYVAPECYDFTFVQASDVFALGLILVAILSGRPAFPEALARLQTVRMVAIEGVLPPARALIEDCWAADPDVRRNRGSAGGDRLRRIQQQLRRL